MSGEEDVPKKKTKKKRNKSLNLPTGLEYGVGGGEGCEKEGQRDPRRPACNSGCYKVWQGVLNMSEHNISAFQQILDEADTLLAHSPMPLRCYGQHCKRCLRSKWRVLHSFVKSLHSIDSCCWTSLTKSTLTKNLIQNLVTGEGGGTVINLNVHLLCAPLTLNELLTRPTFAALSTSKPENESLFAILCHCLSTRHQSPLLIIQRFRPCEYVPIFIFLFPLSREDRTIKST